MSKSAGDASVGINDLGMLCSRPKSLFASVYSASALGMELSRDLNASLLVALSIASPYHITGSLPERNLQEKFYGADGSRSQQQ